MNLELSPEEIKNIRQFFLYIKSNGADTASVSANFEYGSPSYIGGMYGDNGRAIPKFPPVEQIIEKIFDKVDTNDFEDEYKYNDVEYFNIEIDFDTITKKITVDCYYTTPGEESGFKESEIVNIEEFKEYTDRGVSEIICTYNGGGDSGYIDSDMDVDTDSNQPVPSFIEDMCYNALSSFGGWEINEGSQGNIVFNLTDLTISVNHAWNIEENHSFKLLEVEV